MTALLHNMFLVTDDRGIYRIYGLAPGKYKVAAGIPESGFQFGGLPRSLYAQTFASYNKTYGSMGAVIVLLLYFFLSAAVLLLGAEINAALARRTGQPIREDTG